LSIILFTYFKDYGCYNKTEENVIEVNVINKIIFISFFYSLS